MIFISAGHHPTKPGACFGTFCEHDEALKWVLEICGNLHNLGLEYMQVPAAPLKTKVAFINAREAALAVEIHFNSAGKMVKSADSGEEVFQHTGNGALTLYCPGSVKGKLLATKIQEGMETVFKRHWGGVMEGYYRMDKSRGVDFFLRKTKCPAVIVEPEFIHHKELIQQNRFEVCSKIAIGIKNYIDEV